MKKTEKKEQQALLRFVVCNYAIFEDVGKDINLWMATGFKVSLIVDNLISFGYEERGVSIEAASCKGALDSTLILQQETISLLSSAATGAPLYSSDYQELTLDKLLKILNQDGKFRVIPKDGFSIHLQKFNLF